MPKITYHEYRPGRWVKLLDGKAVGPATAEEVAQWHQEQAEQTKIWRDVVAEAAEAAPAPEQPAAVDSHEGQAVQADEGGIWQDVVSQVEGPRTQSATAGELPEPEPPLHTVEEAIRSARRGKPIPVTGGRVVPTHKPVAPGGPSGLPEAKPTPAERLAGSEPRPTKTPPTPVRATPAKQAAKPTPRSETQPAQEPAKPTLERPMAMSSQEKVHAESVRAAETSATKAAAKPTRKRKRAGVVKEEAQPQPAVKADSTKEARPTRQRAEAVPPRVAKAKSSPVTETRLVEQPPKPARKRAKAVAPQKAAELEALPEMAPAPAAEPVKPVPRQAKPARPPLEAEPLPTETVMPADDVAEEEPRPEASAARLRKTTRGRRRGAAAPRRRKAVSTPSKDRLSPAYLWIMVGAAEDLVAAVRGGLARYEERFDESAGAVLCHAEDLAALDGAKLPVDVRPRKGVPRRNFWIGPK